MPLLFSDGRIKDAVRAALVNDSRIKRPELIAISVDEIGTVVLHGAVASLAQRQAAIHDARKIDGVFEVIADDLEVHPPIPDVLSDDQIRAAAMQKLIEDSRISSTHIHLKVLHGRVTLSGYVRHESERAAAIDDLAGIAGILSVVDKISLR